MYDIFRIGTGVPVIKVSDTEYNSKEIISLIQKADDLKINLLILPRLCLTGYTCYDLFFQQPLISAVERSILNILEYTKDIKCYILLGAPIKTDNLYDCQILIHKGKILSITPNTTLSVNELKYFTPTNINTEIKFLNKKVLFISDPIFSLGNFKISNTHKTDICIMQKSEPANVYNLQSTLSNYKSLSSINGNTIIYTNSGYGESTTDNTFAGRQFIVQQGKILAQGDIFSKKSELAFADIDLGLQNQKKSSHPIDLKLKIKDNGIMNLIPKININPFLPEDEKDLICQNIIDIQKTALAKRIEHINCKNLIIGVSGGLDSTIALLCCVFTKKYLNQPMKEIIGITMPGFGTSGKTYKNAVRLMDLLEITTKEISIVEACNQHFKDIGHENHNYDIVFENTQARERTQILFDMANKLNGIVIGTGDFTESALGFATFNGDHISNYNVNSNLPKTVIKSVLKYIISKKFFNEEINTILLDIVNTHISPELLPVSESGEIAQKTEELVGPYELNDFFLYYILKHNYSPEKILFLAQNAFEEKYSKDELKSVLKNFYKRFITQQFKRSCSTDGPALFDFSLSPRTGYQMPSDASLNIWLKEL